MSDYLTNLATKILDPEPAIKPRLTSLFEPLRVFEAPLFDSRTLREPVEAEDFPDETTFKDTPPGPQPTRRPTRRSPKTVIPAQLSAEATSERLDDSSPLSEFPDDQPAIRPRTRRPIRRSPKSVPPARPAPEAAPDAADDSPRTSTTPHDQPLVPATSPGLTMRPVVEARVGRENPVSKLTAESEEQNPGRVLSVQARTPAQSIPGVKEQPATRTPESQPGNFPSLIDGTAADRTARSAGETEPGRNTRIEFLVRQSMKEGTPPLGANLPFALNEPKSDQFNRRVEVERGNPLEQSQPPVISAPPETTSAGRLTGTATPVVIVQPHSVTRASPMEEIRARPPESPTTESTVQVTIGRIEIRAGTAGESRREVQRPAPSKLMSLDDYLRQRAQGAGR